MKIRPSVAAAAAVFLMTLFFAPSAYAQENKEATQEEKPAVVTVDVKQGDTLSSIADEHQTTYIRLFNANEFIANPDAINVSDKIRIPTADEELPDRFANYIPATYAAAPQAGVITYRYHNPNVPQKGYYVDSAGNTYYNGYCTWYAKDRRPDLPNMLGNGGQWVANAAARGYATGSAPRAGAIAEIPGHVAYVESVNPDGTMVISEMNGPAGFGNVGTRTVPSGQYKYIY